MTHKDIYIKFMIEYDKANVTSSYPSLTEYEVATVLDKAYNALIAQKITGNNIRRSGFETDTKAISDLQPLVVTQSESLVDSENNVARYKLPTNFLYFISAKLSRNVNPDTPMDGTKQRPVNVDLVTHEIADKFIISDTNLPWVKQPKAYIESGNIFVVYDPIQEPRTDSLDVTYIKTPNKFAKDEADISLTYFDCNPDDENQARLLKYNFECNDTVAEELVSLAIVFALENIESQRLNSKLNTRGLEA